MAKDYNLPKVEELLEAGVHFGHQIKRKNPLMKDFIYSEDSKSNIIDVYRTLEKLETACEFLYETAKEGKQIIIVGTKRQASQLVKTYAEKAGAMYVNQRWLGGTFTNFDSIKSQFQRLGKLKERQESKSLDSYTKREKLLVARDIEKLELFIGGIKNMKPFPAVIIVIDTKKEKTAVAEANKVGTKVIGIIDTNSDPTIIDYPIPANDDAIKSIEILLKPISEAILSGYKDYKPPKEEQAKPKEIKAVSRVKPRVIK